MDALERARRVLSARVADPKVKFVPGLVDDLKAILGAFEEVARRTDALASAHLLLLSKASLHPGHADYLGEMGPKSADILRMWRHGERCTCGECMDGRCHG